MDRRGFLGRIISGTVIGRLFLKDEDHSVDFGKDTLALLHGREEVCKKEVIDVTNFTDLKYNYFPKSR